MKDVIEAMRKVASGEIENPEIEIAVDDDVRTFKGEQARLVALGVMSGIAMANGKGVIVDCVKYD